MDSYSSFDFTRKGGILFVPSLLQILVNYILIILSTYIIFYCAPTPHTPDESTWAHKCFIKIFQNAWERRTHDHNAFWLNKKGQENLWQLWVQNTYTKLYFVIHINISIMVLVRYRHIGQQFTFLYSISMNSFM